MTIEDANAAGMSYEVWLRWRACTRKKAHKSPKPGDRVLNWYQCQYCGLWHLTGGARSSAGLEQPPSKRQVAGSSPAERAKSSVDGQSSNKSEG